MPLSKHILSAILALLLAAQAPSLGFRCGRDMSGMSPQGQAFCEKACARELLSSTTQAPSLDEVRGQFMANAGVQSLAVPRFEAPQPQGCELTLIPDLPAPAAPGRGILLHQDLSPGRPPAVLLSACPTHAPPSA
jgi:hypothetical protein